MNKKNCKSCGVPLRGEAERHAVMNRIRSSEMRLIFATHFCDSFLRLISVTYFCEAGNLAVPTVNE